MFIIIGLLIGLLGGSDMQAVAYVSAPPESLSSSSQESSSGCTSHVRQLKIITIAFWLFRISCSPSKLLGYKDETEKTKMVGQMLTFLVGKQPVSTFMKSEEG